jgi:WD40 repeat protein
MGLQDPGAAAAPSRALPATPARTAAAHPGGCCSLAVERGGHLVASCGADRTARVWDLALGQQVHVLQGMTAAVNDVAFTADGRALLGAGGDKSLRLWDMASGKARHTLTGHAAAVQCVAGSPADAATAYR